MQNQGHGARASLAKQIDPVFGGYRYEFVTEPPDYVRCTICRLPSRDPYLTDCCGNVFCQSCLLTSMQEKAAKSSSSSSSSSSASSTNGPVCPNARCPNPRGFKMFRNKQIERTVNELKVYCTNKSKGCNWQYKVGEITIHLARNCQFEDIECTNKCGQMVQRQHLSRHVINDCPSRTVKCKYCRVEGQHSFILGDHKETCPKYPVTCPNNCKISDLLQEGLAAHREKCPLEMVECDYFAEGCTVKILRQNLAKHNKDNMEKHFTLIRCELGKAKKKERDIQDGSIIKQDLGQKLDGIKQHLMIKIDLEMSHVKRELAAIRNDLVKTFQNGMTANGSMTSTVKAFQNGITTNGSMTSSVKTFQNGITSNGPMTTTVSLTATTGTMMTTSMMTTNGPKSPTRRHW